MNAPVPHLDLTASADFPRPRKPAYLQHVRGRLSHAEFEALIGATQMRRTSRMAHSARLVLCLGLTEGAAAKELRLARSTVREAVARVAYAMNAGPVG